MGLGAPTKDPETIAQALEEVAEKADKEAERALEDAEAKDEATSAQPQDVGQEFLQDMQEELRDTAADVKEELDKEEKCSSLERYPWRTSSRSGYGHHRRGSKWKRRR